MVSPTRILRAASSPSSRGQNPFRLCQRSHRQVDDRGTLKEWSAPAGPDDLGTVQRQHRDRPGCDRPVEELPDQDLIPSSVSIERRQMLEVFSAEVILTPARRCWCRPSCKNGAKGIPVVLPVSIRQRRQPLATTGHWSRIWRDCGSPTSLRASARWNVDGTGRYLKGKIQRSGDRYRTAARRAGSKDYATSRTECIPGVRAVVWLRTARSQACGSTSRESLEWTRRLVHGVRRVRGSRPARRWPALPKVATEIGDGVIVFIVSDGGWKYLSTGAYTDVSTPRRSRPNGPFTSSATLGKSPASVKVSPWIDHRTQGAIRHCA